MRIGDVLRKWRIQSKLSQSEASARIGLTISTLSRFERGENPDGETLATVLRWLMSPEGDPSEVDLEATTA